MKKITLPNNGLGIFLMLCVFLAVVTIPFVLTLWLVSLVAPWWVAVPCGFAASLAAFLSTVEFKN